MSKNEKICKDSQLLAFVMDELRDVALETESSDKNEVHSTKMDDEIDAEEETCVVCDQSMLGNKKNIHHKSIPNGKSMADHLQAISAPHKCQFKSRFACSTCWNLIQRLNAIQNELLSIKGQIRSHLNTKLDFMLKIVKCQSLPEKLDDLIDPENAQLLVLDEEAAKLSLGPYHSFTQRELTSLISSGVQVSEDGNAVYVSVGLRPRTNSQIACLNCQKGVENVSQLHDHFLKGCRRDNEEVRTTIFSSLPLLQ